MRKLKLFSLLLLLFIGVGQMWATTTTYQHVFNAKPSIGNDVTLSDLKWNIAATNLGNYNSGNYAGVQVGSSKANGSIALTSASAWGGEDGTYKDKIVITEVRLWLNLGGTSVTPTVTIGGTSATSDGTTIVKNSSAGSDWTKATKVTFTPAANGNTGVVVINVATVKAGYICAMEIDCEEAGGGPSQPTLSSIAVSSEPSKTTYEAGDAFDVTGLVVTGTYSDASQAAITEGITWTACKTENGSYVALDNEAVALAANDEGIYVKATVNEITSAAFHITGFTVAAVTKSNLTFTAACGGSGTADDGAVWTVTSDGAESNFDATSGIHYGTNNANVTYLQLTTSDISGNITKVVVNARDAQATATISVTVGGTAFTCTGSATATNTSADYTFTGLGEGEVIIRIDRGSSMAKAIYCKSIVVSYEPCTSLASINGSISASQTSAVVKLAEAYSDVNNASGYQLKVEGSSNYNDWTDVAKTDLTTTVGVTVNGLTCGTNYTAYLRAKGDEGYCEYGTESYVEFATSKYTISVAELTNGTITVNPETACETEQVTLTITPSTEGSGYHLASWSINGTAQDVSTTSFTMPAANVTIAATFEENSVPMAINISETDKATVTSSVSSAVANTNITLSCTNIAEGYQFFGWTVMAGGNSVDVTNRTSATDASFTMPAAIVTVTADIRQMVTVTFHNGSADAYDTKQTYVGGTITLPTTPTSFDETNFPNFVGWAASNTGMVTSAPSLVDVTEAISEDADYWAVFSDAPTTTNNYKKITETAELTNGKYLIVANYNNALHALENDIVNNKSYYLSDGVVVPSENIVTDPTAAKIWTIGDGRTLYNADAEKYLKVLYVDNQYNNIGLDDNSMNLTIEEGSADDAWIIYGVDGGHNIYLSHSTNSYDEFLASANPYDLYLFKQQVASTKWTTRAVAFVTISYDANGVDAQDYTGTLPACEQIESGNDYTVSTAVLSGRTGYNFIGWNTDAEAEVGLSSLTNVTSNTTLHAIWEAIPTHDVKFSVNGSVVTALTLNLQEGASITFPKATVPEGSDKKFVGWIEADSYSSNTAPTFVTSATVGNADKIYYAVFADVVTEGAYEKLTSTTGLAAGDKLVITDGTGQGMKAYASGNNVSATSITLNTNKDAITSLGDACELTLSGESGAWTLFDGVNYIYAAGTATSGSNHMKGKTTSDNACLWEITISNGTTTVKSKNNSYTPYMRYNPNTSNNNPLFSCYNNSTAQNAVTLFKKAANVYSDYVTTIAPLDHIKITTAPKTAYKVGETLDLTDMVVTAYYGEEEATAPNKAVTNYTVSIEAETALTTEHTSFTVTYTEGNVNKTTNQGIHVYELSGITVDAAPEQTIKTEYADGESFDKTKIVVTATWGPAEAQDKIVEEIAADDYTVTPDPLEYGTTTQVVISYQSVYATPITVTVNDRDNYVITWNVAGTTTTTKYYVDDDALVLKAAPEVPEGFEDGFEFMGWTSDATIANKETGEGINYAQNGDQLTGATTFRAVFAKGETTNGYKLSSTAPADGETIIISRLVESTYYALSYDNSSLSTMELAVTNDFVANPADAVLWDIASATNGVFVFPKGETNNRIHINNKEFKVATGDTNGDIVFSDEDNDGAFIAARSDNARWIGGTNSNGFTYTDNVSNAVSLYIFKPYSLTNHSNYRFAPSTVVAPSIELAEGTYYGAQTVTITQEDNKPIYYTRNGGELTLYDNGILLNDNEEVTIVAKAYDSGSNDYSAPVTATYTIIASIEAPTITPASSFIDSKTVEISHPMSETEGFALLYSFDDVEYTAYTEPVVITETKTVYVKATYHNLVAEASPVTYTKTAGTAYDKLTSADQLVVGMQFLIACGTNVAGKPNSPTAQTYLKAVGITTTEDKAFVADEDVQVFTLEGETGAWAFGIGNGKYLIPSGGDVKVSDTKTGAWSIAIASGTPTITCVDNNSNNNTLKYNSGANPTRFKTYNTGQTALTALYYQPYETTYTLTFDVDGTDKTIMVVDGFEYTITNNSFGPTPEGYEATNKWTDGTKQYSVGSKIVMDGNKTLTPCWKVVLNPNPEVPNVLDENDIANNDLIVEHGETVTLSLTNETTMGVISVTNGKVIIKNANSDPSSTVVLTSDSIDIKEDGVVEVNTPVTAPYFRFTAAPGQTAKAGELFGSNNISVAGDIYLDVQLDPTAVDASEWYGISAPYDVNIADGFFTTDGTQLVSNYHFQLWIYDPQKYSNGGRSWTRCTTGVMEANKAYLIGFDPSRFTTVPNVIRLKYAGTQLPSTVESLDIQQYSNGYGWNGVANPNFFNVNVNRPVQIFDNHSHNFLPAPVDETDYNFVATMPLFCQANGTGNEQISFVAATQGDTYEYEIPEEAPTRTTGKRYSFRIQIRKPNSPYYDNQMYVRASEDALATFEEGKDMETLNETCSGSAAIMWTNAYGKHLAIEDAPLQNNQAIYNLTIMTPAAGTYVLRQANEVEGADLYVTYNGAIVWNLSLGDYEMDLVRGTTTGYGLLLVVQPNQMPTGVENGELLNGENGVQKILLNGQLYILRDGHLYDAVGKEMK